MIKELIDRLKQRADSEHEQSLFRIAIGLLATVYSLIYYANQKIDINPLLISGPFLIYASANFVHIVLVPKPMPMRRLIGMVMDFGTTTAMMLVLNEYGAVMTFIFLWVVVGYGFRFGQKYLYLAMALAVPGFVVVATLTPYWREQPYVSAGYIICLLVLPIYFSALLKKYQKQQMATVAAQEETRSKNVFLGMISHELRTPLQTIISSLDLLALDHRTEHDRKIIQRLEGAARRLEKQMKDLTDYARLGAGKLDVQLSPFRIKDLLSEIVDEYSKIAQDKSIELTYDCYCNKTVVSDKDRLRQIIGNLLSNALRYSPDGGRVTVNSECQGDTAITLVVTDTGPGIPEDRISGMFQPFTQIDSSNTRRYEGTGMGLAIVQGLTTLLGGTIQVHSEIGRGTRFEVVLPCMQLPLSGATLVEEAPIELSNRLILVVDDHEEICESFAEMLALLGYRCDTAQDADTAIGRLANTHYDALLLDIHMPGKDGYTVLDALHTLPGLNRTTPAIGISAYVQGHLPRDNRVAFNEYLMKPVHIADLRTALQKLLGKQRTITEPSLE